MKLRLDPASRADAAARRILRGLVEVMQGKLEGTLRDLDPEYLHDFRVAVRRTRSLLGQVKGLFPRKETKRFRREFAWLGKLTDSTRDLDVQLQMLDGYRRKADADLDRELEFLMQYFRRRQRTEQRRMASGLDSDRYRRLIDDWSGFLDRDGEPDTATAANAARPVRELATERIGRAYARVRKDGRALDAGSPTQAVHDLRIDCKKLRYLLEFFRSLFEAGGVTDFVRSLKGLQNRLGDFNDLQVLRGELRRMAGGAASPATGRLVEKLDARQRDLRRRVVEAVRGFVDDPTAERLRGLLE